MKIKTSKAHYKKYAKMAAARGLNCSGMDWRGPLTKERLLKLLEEDQHLNMLPLSFLDSYYPWHRNKPGGPFSLAENCCMYKHALIYGVAECEPEFEEVK